MSAKLERLKALLSQPDLAAWVPPLFPLPFDAAEVLPAPPSAATDSDTLRTAYSAHLTRSQPDLAEHVARHCGPAPWIVRSAGREDGIDFVNAGGYASLICEEASTLAQVVAQVAFSGFDAQARRQLGLLDPEHRPQPIACFIQPLITGEKVCIPPDEAPYLTAEACANLFAVIERLHAFFDEPALDTEWALETDQGLVSATGLTVGNGQGVLGHLAFGFGFASAQTPGERSNALAHTWPGLTQPLWRAGIQRQVTVRKSWLLQVRPAPGFQPMHPVECLTAESRAELAANCTAAAVSPLIRPATPRQGRFLAAVTLDEAWGRYLQWPASARADLAAVFVETGEASEHAGIMFRQQQVAVFRTSLAILPSATDVVVDPLAGHAWFGSVVPISALETETVASLDLPPDLKLVFDGDDAAIATAAAIRDIRHNLHALSHAMDRLLDSAPGTIRAVVRQSIIQRSLWPQPDSWLHTASGTYSPSLFGCALANGADETPWTLPIPAEAADYLDTYATKRDPAAGLPQLLSVVPALSAQAAETTNLRFLSRLRQAEHWAERLGIQAIAPLLHTIDETRPSWLEVGLALLEATERLPIYQDEDRRLLLQTLVNTATTGSLPPADLARAVGGDGPLAPTALVRLLQAPQALAVYLDYLPPLIGFRTAGALASVEQSAALRHAAAALEPVLRQSGLDTVWGLIRIDLIDACDQTLKAVLTEVVDCRDPAAHDRYLALLAGWTDFARTQTTAANDRQAFDAFKTWLAQAGRQPLPANFLLELEEEAAEQLGDEFLRWQVVMPIAGNLTAEELPFTNAHQLHNLLHQWLLVHCRAETGPELPQGLRRLLSIADGFGDARTALLKLGTAALEISLPMVVHKASFLFTEHELTVEFADIPDAPEDEIGRLIVIQSLIRRIGAWQSDWALSSHRSCQFGSWVLYLRIHRNDGASFSADDLQQLLLWLRVLFDTAYDFSYVANEDVEQVDRLFAGPAWARIFQAYVDYRAMIDYARQRPPVYTLPFATTLAALCLDEATHEAVQEGFLSGFAGASRRFETACTALYHPAIPHDEWASAHATAGQLAVLLSAVWPMETFERLATNGYDGQAGELIAQSLLHRRDLAPELHRWLDTLAPSAPLYRLALRHAPDVVIDSTCASTIADQVLVWRRAFKRCKEYLLAYHADQLTYAQCERLIEQLDLIPDGVGTAAQARIRQILNSLAEPRGRFSLDAPDYIAAARSLVSDQQADIAIVIPEKRLERTGAESQQGDPSPLPLDYVRHVIVETACDTTGDDAEEVIDAGRIEIPARDAVEFLVRLQATFDCVFCPLRYQPLALEIDQLAAMVVAAQQR